MITQTSCIAWFRDVIQVLINWQTLDRYKFTFTTVQSLEFDLLQNFCHMVNYFLYCVKRLMKIGLTNGFKQFARQVRKPS